ncbi:MAG: HigA family addiction module antitoxin [Chloroflexi bacterium]|nr:HigA family addiction module antitoxin [Chloroflexota bacterium]
MTTDVSQTDAIIWPGELLQEELEVRGISQRELASRMGRPPQAINEIIQGKKALTAETALGLERVLGIPAYLWVRLEGQYRLALARQRSKSA